jgi:hypothetical protein
VLVGHYGISFFVKRRDPAIPLWALLLAVQFIDALWAVFILSGIEQARIVPGITRSNPLDLFYMPYTHSLLFVFLWSAVAYAAYRLLRPSENKQSALLLSAAVSSHWWLDLLVHRPDLPLYDDSYKLGLGLWNHPMASFLVEVGLVGAGLIFYLGLPNLRRYKSPILLGCLLVLVQGVVYFGYQVRFSSVVAVFLLVFSGVVVGYLLEAA